MKKDERFFNWLNGTIFHKNIMLEKNSKAEKRATAYYEHKRKIKEGFIKGNKYH